MNIREFKVGDVITRNAPVSYGNETRGDSSWCGDRMELVGHDIESKLIFVTHSDYGLLDITYARDAWDEGWCKYPESLWQKVKISLKT